ncbi:MAG TPA: thioredoxin-disulfide reductase, partial [bacterium]|nr:thioredoxin-disulfide reductase [bacterium]
MDKKKVRDVIIIGSGPAGLTAGIYAGRAALDTLILGGVKFGGQLMITSEVENYPGFESILGPELIQKMIDQTEKNGAEILYKDITKVDFSKRPFTVYAGEEEYQSKVVIITTGADPKKLGIPGEEEFTGRGVSYCATCDGAFFKEKEIAVVGGGDSAM